MEQNRLVSDIGFANSLAERKMEAIMGKEASIRMKNLPTIMTCTPCRMFKEYTLVIYSKANILWL